RRVKHLDRSERSKRHARNGATQIAPTARPYNSQGQARSASPLVTLIKKRASPERAEYDARLFRPFRPQSVVCVIYQGRRARFARACPWLLYFAPLALSYFSLTSAESFWQQADTFSLQFS